MDNNYTFDALPERTFPSNFDITHAITIGTAYTLGSFKISAGMNWHSGKPTTRPVFGNEISNGNINFETTNSSRLSEYLRVDVSAMYDFNLAHSIKVNIGASVWNLLDTENNINNFYRNVNNSVVETSQNSLGITPNAVFRVSF